MNAKKIGLMSGLCFFMVLLVMPIPSGMSESSMAVAATAVLMATWWISEALPIAVTALLPIILYPLLGIMSTQDTTLAYGNHMIFLFMGGFMLAVCIEKWNLHKRIALHTINLLGDTPQRILLGFMLATAFLSMWISNTAATMMMLTIALAVLTQSENTKPTKYQATTGFATALMLGIAYAASIGGVATLIGTPPNAILAGVVEKNHGITIGFLDWMIFALPLSLVMLGIAWWYLSQRFVKISTAKTSKAEQAIQQQLSALGSMSTAEQRVLLVFTLVVVAWVTRGLFDFAFLKVFSDASIAIAGVILLFIIPAGQAEKGPLLDWQTAVKIPWDIIILFGGGFALAQGFNKSGLSQWIAQQLSSLESMHYLFLILMITLLIVFLTEVTSNTATASLFIPVMGAMAMAMHIHPLFTMVAVAISASFAFMLPVATPPNAIVFASRALTIAQMARAGLALNLIGVLLISLYVVFVLPLFFKIS